MGHFCPFERIMMTRLGSRREVLAEEYVGFGKEESEYIELKLSLSQVLAEQRKQKKLTQIQLAKMLKSSQSRVAKMECGDPTVSLDLLVKSLLAIGVSKESIAKAFHENPFKLGHC
jgi:ribosome-binding protein aMBF1 (putative translation factor)